MQTTRIPYYKLVNGLVNSSITLWIWFIDPLSYSYAFFGSGSGTIFLDNLGCSGSEANLLDCTHASGSTCTHSKDVGVRCQGKF